MTVAKNVSSASLRPMVNENREGLIRNLRTEGR